jgi:pimeloyl-ACP methyl ester carboxylesterase
VGSPAQPLDAYARGIEIVHGLEALDGPNVNPACRTRLYSHGRRTENALVLLHGFTNCPQQLDGLGRGFFERGWNVLIPRYPRHGYRDRLSSSIAELSSDHLLAVAERAALAGGGLGERVTVAGMSLGGTLAAHIAQSTPSVQRCVMIAPMFGVKRLPGGLHRAVARLATALPNFYVWWDPRLKLDLPPVHAYPRFSSRAYGAVLETAGRVMASVRRAAPQVRSLGVVTNAAEPGLDNRFTREVVAQWRRQGATVDTFEFPAEEGLPHDLVDPASNPAHVIERVYAVVRHVIEGAPS